MSETAIDKPLERTERVRPVRVIKVCRECGADLRPNGLTLPTAPPRFEHVCSADPQKHPTVTFEKQYPTIVFDRCCEGGENWGHSYDCDQAP